MRYLITIHILNNLETTAAVRTGDKHRGDCFEVVDFRE
jgi:hypothetical protein